MVGRLGIPQSQVWPSALYQQIIYEKIQTFHCILPLPQGTPSFSFFYNSPCLLRLPSHTKIHIFCHNHPSAIRALLPLQGIPSWPCFDKSISLFIAAIKQARLYKIPLRPIISMNTLRGIVSKTSLSHCSFVFKATYLVAFSFLRISNLVPQHSSSHTSDTCAEVISYLHPLGPKLLLNGPIPCYPKIRLKSYKYQPCTTLLCVLSRLWNNYYASHQGTRIHHCSKYYGRGKWVPLTDSSLPKNLTSILKFLNLHNSGITFHTFRRSSASLAFQLNVGIQQIQSHGLWLEIYIIRDSQTTNQVAL